MTDYEMSDWSQLHDSLLDLICVSFTFDVDFIRFGCVCTSWRSVYLDNVHRRRTPGGHQIPMLMIPLENHHEETLMNQQSLYSLKEKRVHNFRISVPDNVTCVGSSFGWLVTVTTDDDNKCYPVTLLNPFLPVHCNQIELPSLRNLPSIPEIYVDATTLEKAVVSTNPTTTSSTDYAVMAIYGGYNSLAFWKPGDKAWTSVVAEKDSFGKPAGPYKTDTLFQDIIYHSGLFYGVTQNGNLMVCDINSDDPRLKFFAPPPSAGTVTSAKYIVESSGDLYQVQRNREVPDGPIYTTHGFSVFKLIGDDHTSSNENEDGNKWNDRKWIEVDTLNGYTFFIGKNASMSLSASDFLGCCKPNCIYFTDDFSDFNPGQYFPGPNETAVFNLEYKSFEHHYHISEEMDTNNILSPTTTPIWVEPTLWRTMKPTTSRLRGGD